MELAPIILFVYNRPWHTEKTLKALKSNDFADQSTLFIYADGAKENASEEDLINIAKVHEIITQEKWCNEVHIRKATKNKGLATSILDGVSETVKKYGKVIVLEDDIVTTKGFLKYMNEALTLYADNEKVMHISGYLPEQFPKAKDFNLPETYFLTFMSCWGWATWDKSWQNIILHTQHLLNEVTKPEHFKKYNLDGAISFHKQLEWNLSGKMKTWAIKWFSTIYLKEGLCLHPRKSLVKNVGFDGSGDNSGELYNNVYETTPIDYITVKPIDIEENTKGRQYLREFYLFAEKKTFKSFLIKVKNKLLQVLGKDVHKK